MFVGLFEVEKGGIDVCWGCTPVLPCSVLRFVGGVLMGE